MKKSPIDPIPDHMKFGYQAMVEKDAIRARLIEEGMDPADIRFTFAIASEYEKAHANDLSYGEKQQLWLASQRKPATDAVVTLTEAELRYLVEHLTGVNDEDGWNCLNKFSAALAKLVPQAVS